MNISKIPFRRRLDVLRKALRVPMLSMLATLLSLPANAGITLPTDPLTTASRVPPNIMFILDDSGSMAFGDLANPDFPTICRRASDGGACSTDDALDITDNTYIGNTVFQSRNELSALVDSGGSVNDRRNVVQRCLRRFQ